MTLQTSIPCKSIRKISVPQSNNDDRGVVYLYVLILFIFTVFSPLNLRTVLGTELRTVFGTELRTVLGTELRTVLGTELRTVLGIDFFLLFQD